MVVSLRNLLRASGDPGRVRQISTRKWLASFVGCSSDELQLLRGPFETDRGLEAEYGLGQRGVATVLLRPPFSAGGKGMRLVVWIGAGSFYRIVDPDTVIEW
jgi:hypothetical protein